MFRAHRPDPRPDPYLSLFQVFSSSLHLWYFLAVVRGGRVLRLDWQELYGGLRGKGFTLDIAFREDESRIRVGHAPQHLALVRKLAFNLLRNEKTAKGGIKAKRLQAGWSDEYLLKVLAGGT
jgi:hypothetical protein